ncbi:outer membrane protein assembly factor BamB family protein [Algihabitans albus]|uniref:outer membrane protein assembly factor BamB family protein n=1 Tax=Algihabitans albus TaxID=2164067 RepID=UPI000E5D4763|nr:PQQ-binding-like beta-propeller repeat protein [Algihabitans albus]
MTCRLRRPIPTAAVILSAGLLLSGCSVVDDWFGEEEELLPGDRLAVMLDDQVIEPDPAIASLQIRLPEARSNSDWSQAGGGPQGNVQHLALGEGLRLTWSVDLGEGEDDDAKLLAEPVISDGRVYAMDARAQVSAVDAASGRVLWQVELEAEDDSFFGGGVAVAGDRVFVTTGFGGIYALEASSGATVWEAMATAPVRAAPSVSDGRVFVITLDNQTLALDAATGETQWSHTGIQEIAGLVGAASPAVEGGVAIVPYTSGEVFALLADSGRVLWSDGLMSARRSAQVAGLAHIRAMPVIDSGTVIAVGHSDRTAAIDLRRGLRIWEQELGGTSRPWVAGDFVFLLTNDAQVVALTRDRGQVRWVHQLRRYEDEDDLEDPVVWSGPVLAGDRLILGNDLGTAVALSPYSGERVADFDLPGPVAVGPVVAGGALYFVTEGARLLAYR